MGPMIGQSLNSDVKRLHATACRADVVAHWLQADKPTHLALRFVGA